MPRVRADEPRGEQPLTAAEIEDARVIGDQAVGENMSEERIVAQFRRREVPREAARGAVRTAGGFDERGRDHADVRNVEPCSLADNRLAQGRGDEPTIRRRA